MTDSTALLSDLQRHLANVQDEPSVQLDDRLLEECKTFLVPAIVGDASLVPLVSQIAGLLPQLQQHPGPLIQLLQRLVEPFPFDQVLNLEPAVDFVGGLSIQAEPYNLLILSLIRKAAASPASAAHLAAQADIVNALVNLWLCTPNMGVAEEASATIINLLKVDQEPVPVAEHGIGDGTEGNSSFGLMWRRLFGDKDIYQLLYAIPSFNSSSKADLGKKEKSIAQARLLSWLPHVAQLDWDYVVRSHHPDIESAYGVGAGEGILDFAFVHMTDFKNDVLIHLNLIQSFTVLISTVRTPSTQDNHLSKSLQYLISKNLHQRTSNVWLNPDDPSHDPVDMTFLYGTCAKYFATYVSLYPSAFLCSTQESKKAIQRLAKATDISANQWAHGNSPNHDLGVLSSIPKVSLLPQRHLGQGLKSSPLLQLPCKATSTAALQTLAAVFTGPRSDNEVITFPLRPTSTSLAQQHEAGGARALYVLYVSYHESLFADLISHAATIALPDKALAAIDLMVAIANAEWSPLPPEDKYDDSTPPTSLDALPSENRLWALSPRGANIHMPIATSGIHALFQSPAREHVFPFLMRPPQTFSNLVGGRGDPESSAYKVAMAKWDLLLLVHSKIKVILAREPDDTLQGVERALTSRVAEGPWGLGQEVGGRIATLDL